MSNGLSRRAFLGNAFGAATALNLGAAARNAAAFEARRPNIVIILADDMGYGDPKCYNPASQAHTPNIDRLARAGMRFTHAHAPHAWCVPSRYGLLTGVYPMRMDSGGKSALIAPNRLTLGSMLRRNGYHTACVGKWHLGFEGGTKDRDWSLRMQGGPVDRGFDYFFGLHASLDIEPYYYIENDRPVAPPTDTIEGSNTEGVTDIQGAFWRKGNIAPGFKHEEVLPTLTQKALGFINDHARNRHDQPFFLYFPLTAPHTPWLPTGKFNGATNNMYTDFVTQVDDTVGRVLETLALNGYADNTLVVFSSDNGPVWYPADTERWQHNAAGELRGVKMDMWEGGHRMPFIVRWPGTVVPGTTSGQVVCFTDFMATFAAVVGQDLPENAGEDSFSFLPVLLGEEKGLVRPATVIADNTIMQGPWKLILGNPQGGIARRDGNYTPEGKAPGDDSVFLYNLERDPAETINVQSKHPETVKQLTDLLEKYKQDGRSAPLS